MKKINDVFNKKMNELNELNKASILNNSTKVYYDQFA